MNKEYYDKMNLFLKTIEKKEKEFQQIISDLREPGIIKILDKEFHILLKKLKNATNKEKQLIFDAIEPVIRRKMRIKLYNSEAIDQVIKNFKKILLTIVEEKVKISFDDILSTASTEYKENLLRIQKLQDTKNTKLAAIKTNLISTGELFVAGGFIASDYNLLVDPDQNTKKVVVALLSTIFAGGIYFLRGLKDFEL